MKRVRTNIIAAAIALFAAPAAIAVPAYPGLIKVTQDDGTEIEVRLRGDEYGHFYTTSDNYLIVPDNGVFCYAVPGDAATPFKSSGIRATIAAERTADVKNFLHRVDTDAAIELFKAHRNSVLEKATVVKNNVMMSRAEGTATDDIPTGKEMLVSDVPTKGATRALVVLVQYQDVKFKVENPKEFYTRYMMEKGFNDYGSFGSANEFFLTSSRGQFNPQFDVYGPIDLKQKYQYYGRNSNVTGVDANAHEMVLEALEALDPEVDFSVYDTDNDGKIDNVTVIYAGEGEATSGKANHVWPHAAYINSGLYITKYVDGKLIDHYNCINEWWRAYNRPAGLGTFVHEFSHILGLTDLYDTDYALAADKTVTPGRWSVMDNGPYNGAGLVPPLHSAYEAYCLGWLTPREITGNCTLELDPFIGSAFYVKTDNPNEFFMFESRYRDSWDKELPADGMLVWHIDFNRRVWSRNQTNNDMNHLRIRLVQADVDPTPGTDHLDAFPGRTGAYNSFTATSEPAFLAWSGFDPELPFTEITKGNNGHITAKVAGGGETLGIEDVAVAGSNDAPVEWYTIQGVRVSEPVAGGVYIRRQGSEVSKMLVR